MATIASSSVPGVLQRERVFYLWLAIAMAATVVLGFVLYIAVGISSFNSPWFVHVHAFTFMGWLVLYLTQNVLIVRGDTARHRRLGPLLGAWALWMTFVGSALLVLSIRAHRAPPPVFSKAFLVVMDELNIVVFLALIAAGLAWRARADWHRRLMFCATASIIAPGVGRITEVTTGFSWGYTVLVQLAFVAAAMVFDLRTRGRVHAALLWGAGAIAALGLIVPPVAVMPSVIAAIDRLYG